MSAEDQPAASDAPSETESQEQTTEQADSSFAQTLTGLAADMGYEVGDVPETEKPAETEESEVPTAEVAEPETETETETEEETEKPPEDKDEPEKPKGDKLVPLREVLEEREKKKRANERADNAEALVQQLQSQLANNVGPRPTEADPFIDVQDTVALDRLERSYDNVLEMADTSPDSLVQHAVEAEKKNSGKDLLESLTPEQIVAMAKRKAEKAIRKQIPERRSYLQQRAMADQQALAAYPELKESDSEFTKTAAFLAQSLLSGNAMKAPDALVWICRAVKGYQMETQRNGHDTTKVKSPEAKKIVEASRQKIAPTPTRTRSLPERRGTANLEQAAKKVEETGSPEAAEDYVAAVFSQRGGSKRVESLA